MLISMLIYLELAAVRKAEAVSVFETLNFSGNSAHHEKLPSLFHNNIIIWFFKYMF